ncbi:hypothetical protein BD626DRAFT_493780 [Schizophyllum amplum]|uniref:F-box domain-containing protein n=1 Tax=Schizophyllum amplum TaxID=97359 RepID=A0A550CH22_9AGAR|nr:hypothetical protein BD626DRAFT_493780 [Auriculariopsis ampla]
MSSVQTLLETASTTGNVVLLRSSYAPVTGDAAVISGQLCDLEEADRELLAELARLEAQLQAAQAKHDACHAQIQIHKALLSPVRRLPSELWSQIFLDALPHNDGQPPHEVLNFTQVCSSWRALSFGTPRVWSTVRIDAFRPPSLVVLRKYLERSEQAPLRVWYRLRSTLDRDSTETHYERLFFILYDQLHRWETASVDGMPSAVKHWPSRPCPMLRELQLNDHNYTNLWDEMDISSLRRHLRLFQQAPRLRRIEMKCMAEDPHVILPSSWSALTHIDINLADCERQGDAFLAPYLPLLTTCSRTLRVCKLYANSLFYDNTRDQATIVFPVLEELDLGSDTINLCSYIVAPSLTRVTLMETHGCDVFNDPFEQLACFIHLLDASSNCPLLRCVTFSALNEHPEDVLECLQHLPPSVEELVLSDVMHEDDCSPIPLVSLTLVQALTREHDTTSNDLLPNLTKLVLEYSNDKFWDDELYAKGKNGKWDRAVVQTMRDSRVSSRTKGDDSTLARLETLLWGSTYLVRNGSVTSASPSIR